MSLIEKLLSEKRKPVVLHTAYIYTQERPKTANLLVRCPNRIPVIQLLIKARQRAASTDEPTSSILHSASRTFTKRFEKTHYGEDYLLYQHRDNKMIIET